MRVTTDVHRRGYNFEVEKTPVIGKNVTLTIDSRLQYVAERAIADAVTSKHALRGSIVAVDPYTGEVLALANYPTYDPNERLKAGQKPHGREDFAVVAPFEPGSVFKVITISAALETTRLRPETMIDCGNGILRMGSRTIHDEHRYSVLPVQDVLAHSSNIGAIHIGSRSAKPICIAMCGNLALGAGPESSFRRRRQGCCGRCPGGDPARCHPFRWATKSA